MSAYNQNQERFGLAFVKYTLSQITVGGGSKKNNSYHTYASRGMQKYYCLLKNTIFLHVEDITIDIDQRFTQF